MAHKHAGGVRRAEPKLGYEYDYAVSETQAVDLLGKNFRQGAPRSRRYPPVIGIDLEFDSHDADERPISLVQVSNEHSSVTVLDVIQIAGRERNTRKVFGLQYAKRGKKGGCTLKGMLRSSKTVVVAHGALGDCSILAKQGVIVTRLFDTQIAHACLEGGEISSGQKQISYSKIVKEYLQEDVVLQGSSQHPVIKSVMRTPHKIMERPLPDAFIDYAAEDARYLPRLYDVLVKKLEKKDPSGILLERVFELSELISRGINVFAKNDKTPKKRKESSMRSNTIKFGKYLGRNPKVQLSVDTIFQFKMVYQKWREEHCRKGKSHPPSSALYFLSALKKTEADLYKIPIVTVKSGVVLFGHMSKSSAKRRFAEALERVANDREATEKDKGGIEVLPKGAEIFPDVIAFGSQVAQTITVTNRSASVMSMKVSLLKQDMSSNPPFTIKGLGSANDHKQRLTQGESLTFEIICFPKHWGNLQNVISLNFGTFAIGRFLEARCGDAMMLEELAPVAPYKKRKRVREPRTFETANLVRAPRQQTTQKDMSSSSSGVALWTHPKQFKISPEWRALLVAKESRRVQQQLDEADVDLMYAFRGKENEDRVRKVYKNQMERLLWTEEHRLHQGLTEFNMQNTLLRKGGALYWLKVPGLAEKRPSVLRGDSLHIQISGEQEKFEGLAENIENEEVGLLLSPKFTYTAGAKVSVYFRLSRMPLRIFHQSIKAAVAKLPISLLFPEPSDLMGRITAQEENEVRESARARLGYFNPLDSLFDRNLNDKQRQAVHRIITASGKERSVPYVIFGPPGTGKTTTITEVVKQLWRKARGTHADFHMLVCAATNTATDFICSKLANSLTGRSDVLRLMSYSRPSLRDVPGNIHHLTNWDSTKNCFEAPTKQEIMRPTVVCATLCTAGKLYNRGIPRGHFDLVIIDEAGQALEPEAVAGFGALLSEYPGVGQLVLAGDPKQLGPVIHDARAEQYGLGRSILERMMERKIYSRGSGRDSETEEKSSHLSYNAVVLTKLVENYRSHPTLVELPNKLFYENDLVCRADRMRTHSLLGWQLLPNPEIPMIFEGIHGKDMREGNSPSWFNPDEAACVVRYVGDLLENFRQSPVREEDIGVITPYNKQVHKIKRALKGSGYSNVRVGSTESFQGQEKRVIIISTVRSSEDYLPFDLAHNLGFLDNPKRFNVAITRAQALMIIIGNPKVLQHDRHWGELLKFSIANKVYIGVEPPEEIGRVTSSSSMLGMAEEMKALVHAGIEDSDEPSQKVQQSASPMPTYDL